ncbi:MAG: glycosyltransferase family 87 protein [Ginsengibacter sp.]
MNITETIRDLFHQPYFISFLAVFACFCFYTLKDGKSTPFKKIIWITYTSLAIVTFLIFVVSAINRYYDPQVWDFGAWYLYGKVAAPGYNYYSPENFNTVFNSILPSLPLPLSDYGGFVEAAVNVGFPYPPPTILYFAPLGFFTYNAAYIVWTSFSMVFVVADVYLIYSLFFKSYRWNGLLLASILFFIFLPTLSTISFSQTNFFLLFYLLMMAKYPDKKFTGILFTLAVFTKPYMLILGLFFILRKKWGIILYSILSAILLNGLIFILYGKDIFISYLFDNPTNRAASWAFSEKVNQSLNAVLLRHHLITLDHPVVYVYIIAGILLLMGLFLGFLLKRKLYDFILPTLLLVGLLIYPGTLSHYGVILLFIIFQFFEEKNQLGFKPYFNIFIIAAFFYLTTISVFSAICFLIITIVFKAFLLNTPERNLSKIVNQRI